MGYRRRVGPVKLLSELDKGSKICSGLVGLLRENKDVV
jgi:hypothetical protein